MSFETEKNYEPTTASDVDLLEIQNTLRGDTIGNTVYTQRFVLKTLLKLKDLEWNEELEDDLCFLWDSTLEKEVCNYLMEINFPSIACSVILEYNSSEYVRLLEILVGIMANINIAKCEKPFNNNEVDTIVNLLLSDDSLVLIQVMRFIITVSENSEDLNFLKGEKGEDVKQIINFILTSSVNFELVQKTMEAIAKLTENIKVKLFFEGQQLVTIVNACMRSITDDEENDFELFSTAQRTSVKHLIQYVLNFCIYINQEDYRMKNEACSNSYQQIFIKLCAWYSIQENLLPITEEVKFYFEASYYIISTYEVEYNENIFKHLLSILNILIDNECEEIQEFVELCCYFINKGCLEQIIQTFGSIFSSADTKKICGYLEKQELSNVELSLDKLKKIYVTE
ncbi:hypothetical protein WA026_017196 [Henosepilachna vigintioctopunctata]|uniref:Uncharacterized protein n=1 Tax=Henosepilachna vigintioctopunctata TaxID=420089 RepID=A0AAW1UGK9_9CUCU